MAEYGSSRSVSAKSSPPLDDSLAADWARLTNPFYYKGLGRSMAVWTGTFGLASMSAFFFAILEGKFFSTMAIMFAGVSALSFFMATIRQLERIATAIEKSSRNDSE